MGLKSHGGTVGAFLSSNVLLDRRLVIESASGPHLQPQLRRWGLSSAVCLRTVQQKRQMFYLAAPAMGLSFLMDARRKRLKRKRPLPSTEPTGCVGTGSTPTAPRRSCSMQSPLNRAPSSTHDNPHRRPPTSCAGPVVGMAAATRDHKRNGPVGTRPEALIEREYFTSGRIVNPDRGLRVSRSQKRRDFVSVPLHRKK